MEQRLEGKASGSRNSSLDFIRVMSMFFVIAVHTSPKPLSWSPTFLTAFQMLLLTCNSNFYMMSGELNLQKRFEGPKDYKDYYVNKGISILFPSITLHRPAGHPWGQSALRKRYLSQKQQPLSPWLPRCRLQG